MDNYQFHFSVITWLFFVVMEGITCGIPFFRCVARGMNILKDDWLSDFPKIAALSLPFIPYVAAIAALNLFPQRPWIAYVVATSLALAAAAWMFFFTDVKKK